MYNGRMGDAEDDCYKVISKGENFEVVNSNGRAVMICRDEASAKNYAVLLNEAYREGEKAGRRQSRKEK